MSGRIIPASQELADNIQRRHAARRAMWVEHDHGTHMADVGDVGLSVRPMLVGDFGYCIRFWTAGRAIGSGHVIGVRGLGRAKGLAEEIAGTLLDGREGGE